MLEDIRKKAQEWLGEGYDEATRAEVQNLLENNEEELIEAFYKDMEFGTGGMRGIMGAGTNRINEYTIAMATQGLCNYMIQNFGTEKQLKAAIAYDCRNNGKKFAETTADVFASNGIKVFLFESLRPTPELSFAIRELGCQAGIVITASHNPKEYNGYKAYWEDGAQLISPHDNNVVAEVRKIGSIANVKRGGNPDLVEIIGADFDEIYLNKLLDLNLSPDAVNRYHSMKMVYTPIHGTGVRLVPEILRRYGFTNIYSVQEQELVDGNFPTVESPNPENAEALSMALDLANKVDAELVMATDPDADRVGIAVRNKKNEFVLLNGNQTGAILIFYLLTRWKELGKLTGNEYIVKTIVTTELIAKISQSFGVEYFDVLTGFKYIADIMRRLEGKRRFIAGGEESYGYLAGEFVRDKDAVMACALIAETAAWAKTQGKSLYQLLEEIYMQYGMYREALVNLVKKGKEGSEAIEQMMSKFRQNPPEILAGSPVVCVKDYQSGLSKNTKTGEEKTIELPKSNVLQFLTEDETVVSVRPSGTEPKIKFYIGVNSPVPSAKLMKETEQMLLSKIETIKQDLAI